MERAGGVGIPVRVDHLEREQVRGLVERIEREQGRLDILVNDIWGAENLVTWERRMWEQDLDKGLRTLKLAIETHILTSHAALPLLVRQPGGLVVEVTDGTDALEKQPHFAISETPAFVGRAVAALAADPDRARWSGQSLSSGGLAKVYGFTDVDGSQPDAWRYLVEVQDAGRPADVTGYR